MKIPTSIITKTVRLICDNCSPEPHKVLRLENINPDLIKVKNQMKSPLFERANTLEKEIKCCKKSFDKIIRANIGDSQALGQHPLTFIRSVLACVTYPKLLENDQIPQDVKAKACKILDFCFGNSIGSYGSEEGYEEIRKSVAQFLEKRDGVKAQYDNIFLTHGVSVFLRHILKLFVNDLDFKPTGIMIPIPTCPLYAPAITELGLNKVPYYLKNNGSIDAEELERSFQTGSKTCRVRAILVINPGNPSGHVLTKENMECLIKTAEKYGLLILADEVYQENVYDGVFYSFKKILMEMGSPYDCMQLVSLMSISKGYAGECGIRGGWAELINIERGILDNLEKCISIWLYGSVPSQVVVECVAMPPEKGDESYEKYVGEKNCILESLKQRAVFVEELFNSIDGICCSKIQGAWFAYPRVKLPVKALLAAKLIHQTPDEFYTHRLLEETGICVAPGSIFEQPPSEYIHFRITILPKMEILEEMAEKFKKFHVKFMEQYS